MADLQARSRGLFADGGRLAALACIAGTVVAASLSGLGAVQFLPLGLPETSSVRLVEVLLVLTIVGLPLLAVVLSEYLVGLRGFTLGGSVAGLFSGAGFTVLAAVAYLSTAYLVGSVMFDTFGTEGAPSALGDLLYVVPILVSGGLVVWFGVLWMMRRVRDGDRRAMLGLAVVVVALIVLVASQAYLVDLERRVLSYRGGSERGLFGEDLAQSGPNGIQIWEFGPVVLGLLFGTGAALGVAGWTALRSRRRTAQDNGSLPPGSAVECADAEPAEQAHPADGQER